MGMFGQGLVTLLVTTFLWSSNSLNDCALFHSVKRCPEIRQPLAVLRGQSSFFQTFDDEVEVCRWCSALMRTFLVGDEREGFQSRGVLGDGLVFEVHGDCCLAITSFSRP